MAPMRPDVFYARMMKAGSAEMRRKLLDRAIKARKMNRATLAEKAGISPNTLYNFFKGRSDSLNQTTLEKIADALNVSTAQLTGEKADNILDGLPRIRVVGEVQAGIWREARELEYYDKDEIAVPVPDKYASKAFGLVTEGPSMNKVYPEKTILICVKLHDFDGVVTNGDRVIMYRQDGDLVEATCKEIEQAENGDIWLWPRSTHPDYQVPFKVPAGGDEGRAETDNDGIRIHAVVIGSYRPERASR